MNAHRQQKTKSNSLFLTRLKPALIKGITDASSLSGLKNRKHQHKKKNNFFFLFPIKSNVFSVILPMALIIELFNKDEKGGNELHLPFHNGDDHSVFCEVDCSH